MSELRIVLASASPRRSDLLRKLGVPFESAPTDVDESLPPDTTLPAPVRALRIAERKALAAVEAMRVGGKGEPRWVLAADTLAVSADGDVLGKPQDVEDARRILRALSGTTHTVVTGVVLYHAVLGQLLAGAATTRVTMRELAAAEIDAYVASGECFGKAGAYAVQETADRFVTALEGSFTNVVGLPLGLTAGLLALAGLPPRRTPGPLE